MRQRISAKTAGHTLLAALALLVLFHLLVLARVVPSDVVWGGRATGEPSRLLVLELSALLATIIFALITAVKLGYIKAGPLRGVATVGAWLFFAYLLLNTLSNLVALGAVERLLFTPLTVLLAICAWRVAIDP